MVELLVVIAIIAVLASLLLPSLSRAKSTAHRVKCTSNLRQLGFAAQMYWDDSDSKFFRYRGVSTNGGDFYWFGWLQRGVEGQRDFDATQGALYPYLQGRGVETCPSLNYSLANFKLKSWGAAYGYGYNLQLSAPVDRFRVQISRVARTSETALLADAAQINTFQAPASPSNPMLEEFYYISTNFTEATVHFRHGKKANVVFCDGHVALRSPVPGSIDERLAGQILGRLPTENLFVP